MDSKDTGAEHKSDPQPHWWDSFHNREARSDTGNDPRTEGEPVEDDGRPAAEGQEGLSAAQQTMRSLDEAGGWSNESDGRQDKKQDEDPDRSNARQEEEEEEEKEEEGEGSHWQWSFHPEARPEQGTVPNVGAQKAVHDIVGPTSNEADEVEEGADPGEDEREDVVDENAREDVEEDAADDGQAGGDAGHYTANFTQRCPRLTRSDPHVRLPEDDPVPPQARPIGQGEHAGRNLLAMFGNDTQPRTRYRLQIERARGRSNSSAFSKYPASTTTLPARLTLTEICQQYPNHVWGSALRMFEAEGWDGHRIWDALPRNARHDSARERPWNYIQRIFTRERENVFFERTGTRWQEVRDQRRPAQPARRLSEREQLEQLAAHEVPRALQVIRRIYEAMGRPLPEQDARAAFRLRHDWFLGRVNQMIGLGQQPGQEPSVANIIDALETLWSQYNTWAGQETYAQWQIRARAAAWRMYVVNLQRWLQRWEQELDQLRGGNGHG